MLSCVLSGLGRWQLSPSVCSVRRVVCGLFSRGSGWSVYAGAWSWPTKCPRREAVCKITIQIKVSNTDALSCVPKALCVWSQLTLLYTRGTYSAFSTHKLSCALEHGEMVTQGLLRGHTVLITGARCAQNALPGSGAVCGLRAPAFCNSPIIPVMSCITLGHQHGRWLVRPKSVP